MAKLRKMLGDVNSKECVDMMRLIETQSKATLSAWAIDFAKKEYLPIYEKEGGSARLSEIISACESYLKGEMKSAEIKPQIKEGQLIARDVTDNPVLQAAARAISTACAVIVTPTNALGFLFYGAAAFAYSEKGLNEAPSVYDEIAPAEFKKAHEGLSKVAVKDEKNPAKINWNC